MELFSHTEVCRIVEQFVKNFMRWEGYVPEVIDDLWESFIEEGNTQVKIRREIKVEEVDVKNLDVNRTA